MCNPYQESSAKKPSSPKRSEGVHHGCDHRRLGPQWGRGIVLGLMVMMVTVVVAVAAMAARTARTSCWVVVHDAKS